MTFITPGAIHCWSRLRNPLCIWLVVALIGLTPRSGLTWATKEHIQLTRIAVEELLADPTTPAAMKQWLRQATQQLLDSEQERDYLLHQRVGMYPRGVDGLPYWSTIPDQIAMSGGGDNDRPVQPFGVPERMLHYIDLEYFHAGDSGPSYAPDLSHKPSVAEIPRDMHVPRWRDSGMLPFRVEQCYQKLVESIRAHRLNDQPGQFPRDETAAKWAGFLAHYAQDNTQPHHATIDYRSASYFADRLRAPNVHGDVEYRLVDDEMDDFPRLRQEFWSLLQKELSEMRDPVQSDDPWLATIEVSRASYDALPLIGEAARAAYHRLPDGSWKFDADAFFHFKGTVRDRQMTVIEMKARQEAWAVKRTERLWRKAWDEATSPPHTVAP